MSKNKRIATIGIAALLASFISYIELFFTPLIPIPGIKLGFSNVVILVCLIYMPFRDVLFIGFMKSLLIALLFGAFSSFMYSFPATVSAIVAMRIMLNLKPTFSNVGVSVVGSFFNNITQVFMSYLLLKSTAYFYYLPYMAIIGIITGSIVGIIVNSIEDRKVLYHV